jgi:hypothetical protein
MKSASRLVLLLAALLAPALLSASDHLFTAVPAGDPTYVQLKRLEDLGLLPKGASASRLTRYEVAQLIFKAKDSYARRYRTGVRLAQAELPPDLGSDLMMPPPDLGADFSLPPALDAPPVSPVAPVPAGPAAQAGGDVPPPPDSGDITTQPAADEESPAAGPQAAASSAIGTLEEAYQQELTALQGDVKAASERVKKLENDQFKLWRRMKSLKNSTAIYLHGLGRAFTNTDAEKTTLTTPVTIAGPVTVVEDVESVATSHAHYQSSYLDLNPQGVVSKEIRWSAIFRVQSTVVPQASQDVFSIRRATLEFNPSWMSSTFGDFEESYTPLTLWNRRLKDLRYYPEITDRVDRYTLYNGNMDRDGHLPFRGARLSTAVMWPKSNALDSLSVSTLVHMINSGMVTGVYAPHRYTGWIFGGKAAFKARRYFGVEVHGLMLDEPLDTDDPGSAYGQYDATTWAQRYQVGSVRPTLDYEVTRDVTVGGRYEMAYSIYNDDKRDEAKTVEDYARLGGPFVTYRKATLQFNFVDVGAAYYSPLAQYRAEDFGIMNFMTSLPRASGIFAKYVRNNDNVFPYGLSTPNRKGAGLEADVKAMDRDVLKMQASYYQLREHRGNLVMDEFFTDYVAVDGLPNSPAAVRDFTYINVGPCMDLGPALHLSHVAEVGVNYRSETTESWIGTLKTDQILAGLKVGLKKWWQVSAQFSTQKSEGREAYLNGSTGGNLARYSYLFDNTDMGAYEIDHRESTVNLVQVSTRLDINRNSTLHIDGYSRSEETVYPDSGSSEKDENGGGRLVYEIRF